MPTGSPSRRPQVPVDRHVVTMQLTLAVDLTPGLPAKPTRCWCGSTSSSSGRPPSAQGGTAERQHRLHPGQPRQHRADPGRRKASVSADRDGLRRAPRSAASARSQGTTPGSLLHAAVAQIHAWASRPPRRIGISNGDDASGTSRHRHRPAGAEPPPSSPSPTDNPGLPSLALVTPRPGPERADRCGQRADRRSARPACSNQSHTADRPDARRRADLRHGLQQAAIVTPLTDPHGGASFASAQALLADLAGAAGPDQGVSVDYDPGPEPPDGRASALSVTLRCPVGQQRRWTTSPPTNQALAELTDFGRVPHVRTCRRLPTLSISGTGAIGDLVRPAAGRPGRRADRGRGACCPPLAGCRPAATRISA